MTGTSRCLASIAHLLSTVHSLRMSLYFNTYAPSCANVLHRFQFVSVSSVALQSLNRNILFVLRLLFTSIQVVKTF